MDAAHDFHQLQLGLNARSPERLQRTYERYESSDVRVKRMEGEYQLNERLIGTLPPCGKMAAFGPKTPENRTTKLIY